MLIFVEMMQTASVEAGRTTDDAMDFVTFFQQQFGPYRSINKGDRAGYSMVTYRYDPSWPVIPIYIIDVDFLRSKDAYTNLR